MPEEVLIITVVAILSGSFITIVKAVLGYRERTRFGTQSTKSLRSRESEGASLTTSELEGMMRRAVADATAPLADRMDALESRMLTTGASSKPDLLQDLPDEAESTPVRKTIGNRAE